MPTTRKHTPRIYSWVVDRPPTEEDADKNGRVLVDDPINGRVRQVPLGCVPHFHQWMPVPDLGI